VRRGEIWYHLDQQAKIQNLYIKRYMIPFGEYMPMRPLITILTNLYNRMNKGNVVIKSLSVQDADIYDLERGHEEKIFTINDIKISPKICAEIFFAEYFRESVKKGASLFICPSASNWFRKPTDYYQHVLNVRFRAIETRRWVGYNSSMGGTSVIDALGIVRQETPYHERTVLVTKMPALQGESFYVKYGDLFGICCVLIIIIFIGLSTYQNRKGRT